MNLYRVYQIAKENNLTSKEVIDICLKLGIDAKSHSSSIGEEDYKKITNNLKIQKSSTGKDAKTKEKNSLGKTVKVKKNIIQDLAAKEVKNKSSEKVSIGKKHLEIKNSQEKSKKNSLA